MTYATRKYLPGAGRGVRIQHDSYRQVGHESQQSNFGLTQAFAEYYGTVKLGIPVTLALKGGGAKNYGTDADIPFYKFASIGQLTNLRGYYRNRFSGDGSLYFNSELRIPVGHVTNAFIPFHYGLFVFYDQGRVYYQGASPGGWHTGYGGGIYIAPIIETFAFSLSYQQSKESPQVQFGVGFQIDK